MKRFYFIILVLSTLYSFGQPKQPIIDMHLHALKVGPPLSSEEPLTGLMAPKTIEELNKETIAALERNNVVLALLSGPMMDSFDGGMIKILRGCGTPGDENFEVLKEKFITNECEALAEFAPQYSGKKPNHPDLESYFALAEDFDLPVGIHMGLGPPGAAYKGMTNYRLMDSNPLYLEDVLIRHPNMRLYVMHAGWPFLDEMLGLMHAHPQVYIDIAVINWAIPQKEFYHYLQRLVEAGYGKRIMYGSDQMIWPQSIDKSIEAIQSAPFLSEEQKRDILYNNAAKFLKLSEQEIARHHGK